MKSIDWRLLLEYLKVIIWPLVVVGFVIYFRVNIEDLIKRIVKIKGPGGTEIDIDKLEFQEQKKPAAKNNKELQKAIKPQIKEYQAKLTQLGESEKKLTTELANTNIYLDFERIYRTIFGSQIDLLKRLRAIYPDGESSEATTFMFTLTKKVYPLFDGWSLDQYLNFLFSSVLIQRKEDKIFITDKGKAFLSYTEILNFPSKNL